MKENSLIKWSKSFIEGLIYSAAFYYYCKNEKIARDTLIVASAISNPLTQTLFMDMLIIMNHDYAVGVEKAPQQTNRFHKKKITQTIESIITRTN